VFPLQKESRIDLMSMDDSSQGDVWKEELSGLFPWHIKVFKGRVAGWIPVLALCKRIHNAIAEPPSLKILDNFTSYLFFIALQEGLVCLCSDRAHPRFKLLKTLLAETGSSGSQSLSKVIALSEYEVTHSKIEDFVSALTNGTSILTPGKITEREQKLVPFRARIHDMVVDDAAIEIVLDYFRHSHRILLKDEFDKKIGRELVSKFKTNIRSMIVDGKDLRAKNLNSSQVSDPQDVNGFGSEGTLSGEDFSDRDSSVSVSRDGVWIACADDMRISVWQGTKLHRKLEGHSGMVTSVAFSYNSTKIASGSHDKTIRVWNVATGEELLKIRGHPSIVTCVAFSCDVEHWIASGSKDESVRVWNAEDGVEVAVFEGHSGIITSVGFSPDGRWIISSSLDATVRVWNRENVKQQQVLTQRCSVNSISIAPDSKSVVTGSASGKVIVWNIVSGDKKAIMTEKASYVGYSFDGEYIVGAGRDSTLFVWRPKDLFKVYFSCQSKATSVSFCSDNLRIATVIAGKKGVILWDMKDSSQSCVRLTNTDDIVRSAAHSTDDSISVVGNSNGSIFVSKNGMKPDQLPGTIPSLNFVALSSDEKYIVSKGFENVIHRWNVLNRQEMPSLEGHSDVINCLAISKDSKLVVTGSDDNTVRIWDLASGTEAKKFEGHTDDVVYVAFSPCDANFVLSGSRDKTACIWNIENGNRTEKARGFTAGPNSLKYSANGEMIGFGCNDKTLRTVLVKDNSLTTMRGHSGIVSSVAFPHEITGDQIVSGSVDKTVRVWNTTSGSQSHVFNGHASGVGLVAFSSNDLEIYSASIDGSSVRVWDSKNDNHLLWNQDSIDGLSYVAFETNGIWIKNRDSGEVEKKRGLNGKTLLSRSSSAFSSKSDDPSELVALVIGNKLLSEVERIDGVKAFSLIRILEGFFEVYQDQKFVNPLSISEELSFNGVQKEISRQALLLKLLLGVSGTRNINWLFETVVLPHFDDSNTDGGESNVGIEATPLVADMLKAMLLTTKNTWERVKDFYYSNRPDIFSMSQNELKKLMDMMSKLAHEPNVDPYLCPEWTGDRISEDSRTRIFTDSNGLVIVPGSATQSKLRELQHVLIDESLYMDHEDAPPEIDTSHVAIVLDDLSKHHPVHHVLLRKNTFEVIIKAYCELKEGSNQFKIDTQSKENKLIEELICCDPKVSFLREGIRDMQAQVNQGVDSKLESKPTTYECRIAYRSAATIDLTVERAEPYQEKIFPEQQLIAGKLVERAMSILGGVEICRSKFEKVEFLIVTPNFVTLETQTKDRLEKLGLIRDGESVDDKVVKMTGTSVEVLNKFRDSIKANEKTLFVLITDECHFSPTVQVHGHLLLDKELNERPNFLVLLVSATPQNCLSTSSKVPKENVIKWTRHANSFYRSLDDNIMTTGWSLDKEYTLVFSIKDVEISVLVDGLIGKDIRHRFRFQDYSSLEKLITNHFQKELLKDVNKQQYLRFKTLRKEMAPNTRSSKEVVELPKFGIKLDRDKWVVECINYPTLVNLEELKNGPFMDMLSAGGFWDPDKNPLGVLSKLHQLMISDDSFINYLEAAKKTFECVVNEAGAEADDSATQSSSQSSSPGNKTKTRKKKKSSGLQVPRGIFLLVSYIYSLAYHKFFRLDSNGRMRAIGGEEYWRSTGTKGGDMAVKEFLLQLRSLREAISSLTGIKYDMKKVLLDFEKFSLSKHSETPKQVKLLFSSSEAPDDNDVESHWKSYFELKLVHEFNYLKNVYGSSYDETDRIVHELLDMGPGKTGVSAAIRVYNNAENLVMKEILQMALLNLDLVCERRVAVAEKRVRDSCADCKVGNICQTHTGMMDTEMIAVVCDCGDQSLSKEIRNCSQVPSNKARKQWGYRCNLSLDENKFVCVEDKNVTPRYIDLENLPCIIILTEKGRMGDTFSHSLRFFDLRIRVGGAYVTFIQEIGRLCRYPSFDNEMDTSSVKTIEDLRMALGNEKHFEDGWTLYLEAKDNSDTNFRSCHLRSFAELQLQLNSLDRYRCKWYTHKMPVAIVTGPIYEKLTDAFEISQQHVDGEGNLKWTPRECLQMSKLDAFVTGASNTKRVINGFKNDLHGEETYRNMKIKDGHYNYGDSQGQLSNRMLLWAECQIGKTGAFLGFLRELRRQMEVVVESTEPSPMIKPIDDILRFYIPSISDMKSIAKQKIAYEYPKYGQYHALILKQRVESFKLINDYEVYQKRYLEAASGELLCSKKGRHLASIGSKNNYFDFDGRFHGFSRHDVGSNAVDWEKVKCDLEKEPVGEADTVDDLFSKRLPKTSVVSDAKYAAKMAPIVAANQVKRFSTETWKIYSKDSRFAFRGCPLDDSLSFKISLPDVKSGRLTTNVAIEVYSRIRTKGASILTCIKSWVFIPSFKRADNALFDYSTAIDSCRPVLVFVRESDFLSYQHWWGHSIIIVAVPNDMLFKYSHMEEHVFLSASQNGVGYQRLCIQLFASSLNLPWIFQLDDNIHTCHRYSKDGIPEVVQFEVVMQCIEYLTRDEYRSERISNLECLPSELMPAIGQQTVQDIMGNPEIGLVGIRRGDFSNEPTKTPISCTYSIYSFLAMNIRAFTEKQLYYPAKRLWEDIELTHMVHEGSLAVLKMNVFSHSKVHKRGDRKPTAIHHLESFLGSEPFDLIDSSTYEYKGGVCNEYLKWQSDWNKEFGILKNGTPRKSAVVLLCPCDRFEYGYPNGAFNDLDDNYDTVFFAKMVSYSNCDIEKIVQKHCETLSGKFQWEKVEDFVDSKNVVAKYVKSNSGHKISEESIANPVPVIKNEPIVNPDLDCKSRNDSDDDGKSPEPKKRKPGAETPPEISKPVGFKQLGPYKADEVKNIIKNMLRLPVTIEGNKKCPHAWRITKSSEGNARRVQASMLEAVDFCFSDLPSRKKRTLESVIDTVTPDWFFDDREKCSKPVTGGVARAPYIKAMKTLRGILLSFLSDDLERKRSAFLKEDGVKFETIPAANGTQQTVVYFRPGAEWKLLSDKWMCGNGDKCEIHSKERRPSAGAKRKSSDPQVCQMNKLLKTSD